MTLLSDIAGQRGENLCSSLLAHILMRSPEAREGLISLFSARSPRGPIVVQNQFAVFCEEATGSADDERRGRLDVVIETDDAILGIENKFNAHFQDQQPGSYLEHLKDRAEKLHALRHRDFQYLLFVLAPRYRESEVRRRISEQSIGDSCEFLAWEELLEYLEELERVSDIDRFLIHELKAYATEQITPIADLERLLPHLRRFWSERGSSSQRQFLNHFLWSMLDERLTKNYQFGAGADYYGYYFRSGDSRNAEAWLGFVNRAGVSGEPQQGAGAALVCQVKSDDGSVLVPRSEYFAPVEVAGWPADGWSAAELCFEPDKPEWAGPSQWRLALDPVNQIFGSE